MSDEHDATIIAPLPSVGRVVPGMRLNGIYQIDELIGSGGMSEIYRGHNIQTDDAVAIKIIRPAMADDERMVSLFRREALTLGRLNHPAIVRYHVFSHDEAHGLYYLAMEFVDGPTLRNVLRSRTLSQAEAAAMTARVARGMDAAHREGVVHRDLSPDNIVLVNGAVANPKVIDFGIARAGDGADHTLLGSNFAGKLNFVSPEQLGLFGGEVTPRSDIYSLGLVLASALLGRPIDMGGSHVEVVNKRQSTPDLGAINPGVRPLLEAMLQPNPAERPASMGEVAEKLEALAPKPRGIRDLAEASGAAARKPKRKRRLVPALLFLALLGGGAWFATQTERGRALVADAQPTLTAWGTRIVDAMRTEEEDAAPTQVAQAEQPSDQQPATTPNRTATPTRIEPRPVEPVATGEPSPPRATTATEEPTPPPLGTDPVVAPVVPRAPDVADGEALPDENGAEIDSAPTRNETAVAESASAREPEKPDLPVTKPETEVAALDGATERPVPALPPTTEPTDPVVGVTDLEPEPEPVPAPEPASDPEPRVIAESALPDAAAELPPASISGEAPTEVAVLRPTDPIGDEPQSTPRPSVTPAEWVNRFGPDECFHARVVRARGREVEVEGFGREAAPFQDMDRRFAEAFGREAQIGVRLVTDAQCPLVEFARALPSPERQPRLSVRSDTLGPGEPLMASLENADGASAALFVATPDGVLVNVSEAARRVDDAVMLELPNEAFSSAKGTSYLLVAVVADGALGALDRARADDLDRFLADLDAEARRAGVRLSTALKYLRAGG